jgi:hypothetical protein
MASNTLASNQRWVCWKIAFHGGVSFGSIRHGAPARERQGDNRPFVVMDMAGVGFACHPSNVSST